MRQKMKMQLFLFILLEDTINPEQQKSMRPVLTLLVDSPTLLVVSKSENMTVFGKNSVPTQKIVCSINFKEREISINFTD